MTLDLDGIVLTQPATLEGAIISATAAPASLLGLDDHGLTTRQQKALRAKMA